MQSQVMRRGILTAHDACGATMCNTGSVNVARAGDGTGTVSLQGNNPVKNKTGLVSVEDFHAGT